jgi:hypothetical protein
MKSDDREIVEALHLQISGLDDRAASASGGSDALVGGFELARDGGFPSTRRVGNPAGPAIDGKNAVASSAKYLMNSLMLRLLKGTRKCLITRSTSSAPP